MDESKTQILETQHTYKGRYSKENREYTGLPQEFYDKLLTQFGHPILSIEKAALPEYNNAVPHVLEQLKQHVLATGGLAVEDIFRVSPSAKAAEEAKALLDKNQDLAANNVNAQTAAYLIKCYFKDLPEPFFNRKTHGPFLTALDEDSLDLSDAGFAKLVELLEEARDYSTEKDYETAKEIRERVIKYNTFCWLADLGVLVASHEAENKMTQKSFSTVVTPNLVDLGVGKGFLASNLMGNLDEFFIKFMQMRASV